MDEPLTPRYPAGSHVVVGHNRQYLLVPLGNVVDERYTVYFDVTEQVSGRLERWLTGPMDGAEEEGWNCC